MQGDPLDADLTTPGPVSPRFARRRVTVSSKGSFVKTFSRLAVSFLIANICGAPIVARAADRAPRDLDTALRAIIDAGPLSGARAGLLVTDVESGEVLFQRDADALLNPASNVKLVTTAAVLARLGADFRFDTELYVDGDGHGARTLYVKGKGDPSLVTERLWAIAGDLAHLGLGRIGDVVVDDTFFEGDRIGPGFDQEEGDKSYLAPTGAASLNWNTVAVNVAPGDRRGARARVELEPASDLFQVDVRATTSAPGSRRRVTVSSTAAGARQRIVVDGRVPQGSRIQVVWRRIDNPPLYLGHTLRRLLEQRGVKVTGKVRTGAVPAGARLVHVAQSESLGEIVRRLNKTSNNFVAEQLLETLGAETRGAPGSWAKGVEAVGDFLADLGVPRGAYVMKNGSGLNDANRFSARQLVTVLRAMWARFPLHAEYVVSLPVAGRDGTIRYRMEGSEAEGRLRAKTGTLEGVTSLSGYVQTAGNRTLAFAFLVNDFTARGRLVNRSLDALGVALAASGGPPAALGAAVALAKEPAAPGASAATPAGPVAADLAAAVRTWYALGRAADSRNLRFLRTALRSERDPALRLAVAECVYLSDPDGETSRRTFLDAVPPDGQVLARLWAAAGAGASEAETPVLPSLGDLAAEGIPDALARLVELAPAGALDPALGRTFGAVLADVSAEVPEELLGALRGATPAAQEAAVVALGTTLARADRDHPFQAALQEVAKREDDLGAFARALGPRVAAAVAASASGSAQNAPTLVPAKN
jgi:D-alanyl-D-alanine carboxypeptidase/D-alanyl-D-alanine-endopeptidase (penicillin-binding protein 4)